MSASPADLLFWAEQVRRLPDVTDGSLPECADLIARHMEHAARQALVADITGQP